MFVFLSCLQFSWSLYTLSSFRQKNRKPDSNENCDEMKEIKDDVDQEGVYSNETGTIQIFYS